MHCNLRPPDTQGEAVILRFNSSAKFEVGSTYLLLPYNFLLLTLHLKP